MTEELLISVIVPVFQVEEYLEKCISSILHQTYKNLEIILVDDGSADGSGEMCDKYALSDNRINVIHKENGGLSSSRNAGIEIAKGKYLCFVDSDDMIHEQYIEKLWRLCVNYDADIAQCDFLCIDKDSKLLPLNPDRDICVLSGMEALREYCFGISEVQYCVSWNKLYRKELFDGIRFPVGRQHEDVFTSYKLLYKAKRVVLTSEYLYYYLQRADSITGKGFTLKFLDRADAFKERIDFLHEHSLLDEERQVMIRTLGEYKKDYDMLKEYYAGELEIIESVYNYYIKLKDAIGQNTEKNAVDTFSFDKYEEIVKKDWVLYGAGGFGRFIYNMYKERNYGTLKLWVDNFWHTKKDLDYKISPLDRLHETKDNKIVVAIVNDELKRRIISDLIAWGIAPEMII